MPAQETLNRTEKAVIWSFAGADRYGEATVNDPEEILVRSESLKNESDIGDEETVAAQIEILVAQDITVGSIIWFGDLVSLPDSPTDLYQVDSFEKIPDLKGRNYARIATLSRFRDALPTISSGTGT